MSVPHFQLAAYLREALLAVVPDPPAEEVRTKLQEVLSRPEFAPPEADPWLRQFWRWLLEVLSGIGEAGEASPVLFWVLLIGCITVLLAILAHVSWTVYGVWTVGRRPESEAGGPEQRARLSLAFRDEAKEQARHGRFTEAIRCLFLSLVYRFDEHGRVNFRKDYTNREYLALFAERPPVSEGLAVFVDALDDYWYGQKPTNAAHYERCLAVYESLSRA